MAEGGVARGRLAPVQPLSSPDAMGVVAARLVFLAFVVLTGSIIYNALYLQDLHGTAAVMASGQAVPMPEHRPSIELVKLPPVSTDVPTPETGEGGPEHLLKAVQRELAARGYDVGPEDGKLSDRTAAAISSYQKGQGLPITGVATDELLRHILLGGSVQPVAGATGSVKPDGAKPEEDTKLKAVQKILADLGYAPGPVDGALGGKTIRAITTFQRDRKIAETGKITPELLRELKRVTGRDLTKLAAGQ
jgi:peptidoglycan hydrolase-like protein with peptidoglycan-binding domain